MSITASCNNPPVGTTGTIYTHSFTSDNPAAHFYLLDGTLPPGLTLFADGIIFGNPSANGSYVFSLLVTAPGGSRTRTDSTSPADPELFPDLYPSNVYGGPFEIGSDLYAVQYDQPDKKIAVIRSTDGGATWASQDTSHRPSVASYTGTGTTYQGFVGVAREGTTLHLAYVNGGSGSFAISFISFNTATNLFGASSTGFTSATDNFFIAVRGDGTKVIVYKDSGNNIYYRTWDYGPTLGTPVLVASSGWIYSIVAGTSKTWIATGGAYDTRPLTDTVLYGVTTSVTGSTTLTTPLDSVGAMILRSGQVVLPFVEISGTHGVPAVAVGNETGLTVHEVSTSSIYINDITELDAAHRHDNPIAATAGTDGNLYVAWITGRRSSIEGSRSSILYSYSSDLSTWASPLALYSSLENDGFASETGPDNLSGFTMLASGTLSYMWNETCCWLYYGSVAAGSSSTDSTTISCSILIGSGAIAVSSQPSLQMEGNVEGGGLGVETVEIDCSITVFPSTGSGTCLWIDLWVWRQLVSFSALDENVQLPPAYQKALTLALAVQIASEYKRLPHAKVLELADKARAAIEGLNDSNHVAQEDPPNA